MDSAIPGFSPIPGVAGLVYDLSPYIRSFSWEESYERGGWSAKLAFKDSSNQRWRKIVSHMQASFSRLRIRYEINGSRVVTPWQRCWASTAVVEPNPTVLAGAVELEDERFLLMKKSGVRAWKSVRVLDVLRELAVGVNLSVKFADLTDYSADRWQFGCSDWDFIQYDLTEKLSFGNRGDVYCLIQDGKLVVGPPNYSQRPKRSYTYGTGGDSRIISARFLNRGVSHARGVGGTLLSGVVDPDTKSIVALNSTQSAIPSLGSRNAVDYGEYTRYSYVRSWNSADARAKIQQDAHLHGNPVIGEVTVGLDVLVRVGDTVFIEAIVASEKTPFYGSYLVTGVEHSVGDRSITRLGVARYGLVDGSVETSSPVITSPISSDVYPTTGRVTSGVVREVRSE